MRPAIQLALQLSAELTRRSRFVDALQLGAAAINQATDAERAEIRQWLDDHTDDFIGRTD
ncbi:hypothetical protein FCH28_37040 [Streptomyces piniterrae]|uniref:Uncharacterized protein n=1 Tax=Streptomyces piniterrae TaxID=2571125 RepID=A0A4U0MWA2_9ACTN|nr:hypothetical protein [Streptomyces piniterrae]TJZ41444.1 hypothetical protein FCH28_37040 [Streptomyces piniterrae]